jgi:protein DGCR14
VHGLGIMAANTASATEMQMMPPPKPRVAPRKLPAKPQQLVLEEDEWAEQLEAIIERDFFPDVPKLQSKLEWLQVGHRP